MVLETCSQQCAGSGLYWLVRADSEHFFSTTFSDFNLVACNQPQWSIYTIKIGNLYKSGISFPGLFLRSLPAYHYLYSTPYILPIPLTHTYWHVTSHHRACKHITLCICVCINTQRITYVHFPLHSQLGCQQSLLCHAAIFSVFLLIISWSQTVIACLLACLLPLSFSPSLPLSSPPCLPLSLSLLNSQLFSCSYHEALGVSGITYRIVKSSEAIT